MLAVWPLISQHTTESVILQEFLDEYYSEENFRKKLKEAKKSHRRKKARSQRRHRRKRNHKNKVSSLQILSMVSEMVSHMGNGQGKSKILDGRFRWRF